MVSMMKGITNDFFPDKDLFHLLPANVAPGSKALELRTTELKVVFKDGELMVGTAHGHHPNHPGFFVVPVDTKSNIERCFLVTSVTHNVSFI